METKLYLKQQQKLVMTIMLQQAIKLLPLTRLELVQRINQELLENPLLEDVSASEDEDTGGAKTEDYEEEATPAPSEDEFDWEIYLQDDIYEPFSSGDGTEDYRLENTLSSSVTLHDHLFSQLIVATDEEKERRIGTFLIGNIDDDGYLQCRVEEAAQILGVETAPTEKALGLIQTFDPTGVGARDLRECLLLQLQALEEKNPIAEELLTYHLDQLKDACLPKLARKLKLPMENLLAAVKQIRELDPKPGHKFNQEAVEYIVPDITVVKVNDEYQVILNEEDIPKLRINSLYKKLLRQRRNVKDPAREFIEDKIKSALWLIRSIDQRRQTLYKVAKSIVKFQRSFLDYGMSRLKPMVLRDVAQDIEMHESTVSRTIANKYIHTPQGLFELKFFFHSGINSTDGTALSSVVVKELLQKIVGQENGDRPLTDKEIVELFRETQIQIARRTVAKYRKELKIPCSGSRKRISGLRSLYKGSKGPKALQQFD